MKPRRPTDPRSARSGVYRSRGADISVLIGNSAAGAESGKINRDGESEGPHQCQPCRLSRQGVHPRNSDYGLGRSRQRRGWHPKILASYPSLMPEDIEAALAYAAELVREGSIDLPAELTARNSR